MKKQSNTKQELLFLLKKNESLTVNEIMSHFSISEPAVRKHIHELEKQQFIQKKAYKQKIGRPFYKYQLTKQGHKTFPNQNEKLPLELLKDLEELHGKQAVNELLTKRMEREIKQYKKEFKSDEFEAKVNETIRLQNDNGYMVEIHKNNNGEVEIINYHCPIMNIASTYHQVCENEKKMYETLFPNSNITLNSKIAAGDQTCKWIISPPEGR